MFSKYIMRTNNATSKKILHHLFGKKLLSNTRLHVSTQLEWDESQKIIPNWHGAIITNLVALPTTEVKRKTNSVFTIGFLSRIDPKKGLNLLIQALSKVNFRYRLLVAGDGEEKYIQSLQYLSKLAGNTDCIEWVGWKNGDEKFEFLAQFDLFSLTSHSENFAIVVIESLSVGTPVLISNHVGLTSYINQYQLGWITTTDIATITANLQKAYDDIANRKRIELASPGLIEQHFNKISLTERYINLYTMNLINR